MPSTNKTVRAIFEEALELEDSAQRRAFLERACGGVESLRREVEGLLKAHESAGGFLNHPEPADAVDLRSEDGLGARIGRYKLLRKLGEGGWGVVYLAEQNEPVYRQVALKVIRLGMDTRKVIARFEAERQALALMDHPNIARVFDAGATETGRPYFVMELVRGTRITEYCDEHRLSTAHRLDLFKSVCEAIQHAHQKGIIHRDIKPSNILITLPEGSASQGCAKVIDFGIAKATEERLTENTFLTELQTVIGTPAYMSPEQAMLGSGNIDTRSDIYSLGVVLYELLTGKTPFEADALMRSGLEEMRRTLRETEPARPSTRIKSLPEKELTTTAARRRTDPPGLVHELRGDLDWIVMKCLDKERSRRYQTASELAADVDRYLQHRPITARPPHPLYLLQKTVRRHRLAVTAAGALTLILVAGVVVSSLLAMRASRAERRERNLREQADIHLRKAEEAREEARAHAYAGDMKGANTALNEGNLGHAVDLLRKYFPRAAERDLRGVEWRYLWMASRGNELRSFAHPSMVGCVALSPDGRLLATACFDGNVRMWNAISGELLNTFSQVWPADSTGFADFIPEQNLLASASRQGVTIREIESWALIRDLAGSWRAAALSANGKSLASLGDDGLIVWDTKSWRTNLLPAGATVGWAAHLALTSDGQGLAATSQASQQIDFWEVAAGSKKYELAATNSPNSVAISPDGRWLAAGGMNGQLILWSLATGEVAASTKPHSGWLLGLAFSPDSQVLATGGGDQLIALWDVATNTIPMQRKLGTLKGHRNEIWWLAYSSDGRRIVSGSKDATAKLWNASPEREPSQVLRLANGATFLGNLSKDFEATVVDPQGDLELWDTAQNQVTARVILPANTLRRSRLGPELVLARQTNLFFATTNGTIQNWSLPKGRPAQSISLEAGLVSLIGVSPDRKLILGFRHTGAGSVLWDFDSGRPLATLPQSTISEGVSGVIRSRRAAFSPDGRLLAYTSTNFSVKLWDIPRSRELFTLSGHTWNIYCVQFSPDGAHLATSSWDGSVRLWDPNTGTETVFSLKGHLGGVNNLTFSPDSRTLITSGDDNSVRFWSVATGTEMISISGIDGYDGEILSADANTIAWKLLNQGGEFHISRLPTLLEIDTAGSR